MRRWLKKAKDEGLSLRLTFILMLIAFLGITSILLFTTYRTFLSYHALSDATDTYMKLQDAASNLLNASDYLTEEARCYVVLSDRTHLDNYFTEAEVTKRREKAIEDMTSELPDSEALVALKQALTSSVSLMEREYYAMLLVLDANHDKNVPEAMSGVRLSEEDMALSAEEKKVLAQTLMHDEEYFRQKNLIRDDLKKCVDELKTLTHGTQESMNRHAYHNLVWMAILIVIQSLGLILMLILTTRLGINPLLQAVEHIKRDQSIPIIGAHEFRYLAETYNKMYAAYKKSIDQLSYKASHDELTKVYNRAGYDLIKNSIDTTTTALLLVDADQFKSVNDHYGHEVGDMVLKKLAVTLQQNFRPDDYIFRIGGDEFVVFMVHVNEEVKVLIEKKVVEINRELADLSDGLPKISVSVGVSLDSKKRDPQEMFREADTALYFVKDHGRNCYSFYKEEMRNNRK